MLNKAEYQRQWRKKHPNYNKTASREWLKNHPEYCRTEKSTLTHYKTQTAWRIKNPNYNKEWKKRNPEKLKLMRLKANAKRRQNLNWIQLFENPFDKSEKVEWHHINNTYVVAIPRDLHRLYYGKYHREKTMEIIKQIYGG